MIKSVFVLICSFLLLQAASFEDDDFDGVPNALDKCPNSSFEDIVDKDGCKKEKVHLNLEDTQKSNRKNHLNFTIGWSYYKTNEETSHSHSISLSYIYKDWSFYLNYDANSLNNKTLSSNDLTLALYWDKIKDNFIWELGAGAYLPTKNKNLNKTDYFLSSKVTYYLKNYEFSFTAQYNIARDYNAKNNFFFTIEAGSYLNPKNLLTLSYTWQRRVYKNEKNSQTISLGYSYFINKNWYFSFDIDKSLIYAKEKAISFYIGYYF